jgi:hypothetical protein
MAFVSAQSTRLLVGDFNLAAYTTQAGSTFTQEVHDTTTLVDTAKQFILGQETSTFTVAGLYDAAQHTDEASFKASSTPTPISYAPRGFALGREVWLVNSLLTEFATESSVSSAVAFQLNCQTDGGTDIGVSLVDHAAITSDTNGTGVDGSASSANGGVAHLHVTAFSGFSSAVVTVADSANNSTFATIGTFTTVSGVTAERISIAGTIRQYTRYVVDVTGSGSITMQVGLARR